MSSWVGGWVGLVGIDPVVIGLLSATVVLERDCSHEMWEEMTDSAQGLKGTSMPIWALRLRQGQTDAHRITREIRHRACGSKITTFQHLKQG